MQERLPFCAIRPSKGGRGFMSASRAARHNMLLLLALLLISYGVGNAHCSTVPDNSTDMLSLLDFKLAITNDPRQALRSWNNSIPHCKWEGVNCSLTHPGRVTTLNLGNLGLSGPISRSLGNLTFLRILDLSNNSLAGELPPFNRLHRLEQILMTKNSLQGIIPDTLTNCSNLNYLDLSGNFLIGEIPRNIGLLSNLSNLVLSENKLTGTIPPSLKNISQLLEINLADNRLTGSIPDEIGQFPSLFALLLGGNKLSGRIPTTLFNQSYLQLVDLSINMLGNTLPSNFGDALPSLTLLGLDYNNFEGHVPPSLGNISRLSSLDLSSNKLTGQVPTSLGRLGMLNYLNLQTNKLEANDIQSWEFIDALSNCKSLQELSLGENQLQGAIPSSIGKLSIELQTLGLAANDLSGTIPTNIGNLNGLTILDLRKNKLNGSIEGWVGKLKNLAVLALAENNFTGRIPSSIGTLTKLTKAYLAQNEFEGSIPPSMGNLIMLTLLNLSYNNLQGNIPKELFHTASTLTKCSLSYNKLEGPIPSEISNLKQLNELYLSSNQISGDIPTSLGNCQELTIIEMGHNFLTGSIPVTLGLGGLPILKMLNLSHNNLSGFIPIELSNMLFLTQLDLSNNSLQGEIPTKGVFGNVSAVSLGGNWRLCGGSPDLHMPLCPGVVSQRSETEYYLVRALIPIFGFTSLVMLTFVIIKKKSQGTYKYLLSFGRQFPRVSYKDLSRATVNFSEENLLGRGSYGSVYRGKLTLAKIQVAIKVFDLDIKCADKSFVTECEVLRSIRHRNLVPILTACSTIDNNGDTFKALIYEFMPNGNLDTWLHNICPGSSSKSLSLAQRASIAVGIAEALVYLHHDCERQIVHCDLKPTNILLDDDMNAYLGDFGIASLVGHSSSNTSVGLKGTIGYIAPEYAQSGQASIHGDVYSFGIVLLEMMIGKRPTDPLFENELNLVNFAERNYPDQILHIIDGRLQGECEGYMKENITMENAVYGCLLSLMQVALSCTCLIPRERMNIREVTNKLHFISMAYIRATKREQVMFH